jgi:hypothetical protein
MAIRPGGLGKSGSESMGLEPQISLEDGLACTYEWIEEQVREIA